MTSPPANPPTELPALVRRLFDADVAVAEVDPREVDPEHVLLPVERDAVARAIDTRRLQYAAGRHCARSAMRTLAVPPGPVTQDDDRAPRFPPGLVGTITHTQWWCAAAVALESTRAALGVDVEPDSPLKASLFGSVLTPDEITRLEAVPDDALRGLLGKLIFSAKECAYKCQYTLSRTFYGFHGMRVELPSLPATGGLPPEGEFAAIFLRDAGPFRTGDALHGRYVRAHGYLMTGVELRHGR
ncbi:MAG: 4'-phosphopantetheinyl transferase superfamily protein [Sandaracinaceae bacterium]|nr:4'-phosphopantetheinyl transferase superfamily protein [Sandaracinaceae bacterium]MBP7683436.1 4'-phosphopantetheinyl transferase superfamily protein [Deltaproteobacteria bacterium]MBK7151053.1 4'-phosphopantetheinyl transferase superfamily protein [Sandaracinaceae bacterium]MBK7773172.1 4'-phosphopantetheinyl transferase superfamily protein [Sandaracinaceae bacterium]MBK8407381.1 4'-phosphopantetheinyl transferase superfamily protein [Sandaracinaceae bacterium]